MTAKGIKGMAPKLSERPSSNGRQSDALVNNVQRATGALLGPFVGIHLAGHLLTLVPGSEPLGVANTYLLAARELYQGTEKLGLGVLVLHGACGVYKWLVRRRGRIGGRGFTYWTRLSGVTIGTFIFGHIWFTRVAALLTWGDSSLMDYSYIHWSIQQYGVPFTVYYITFGAAGIVHGINGARSVMSYLRESRPVPRNSRPWNYTMAAALGAMTAAVITISGYVWNIDVPLAHEFHRMHGIATARLLALGGL